ncbi:MAG: hypothetical protein Q7J33_10265, partial [Serpentinimonas sp.]|nr:hypothetical protein [Serpentinimonas sp.]
MGTSATSLPRREAALPTAASSLHGRILRRRLIRGAVNLLIAAVALFPILWGLSSSLKPTDRIIEFPP